MFRVASGGLISVLFTYVDDMVQALGQKLSQRYRTQQSEPGN